MKIYTKTGDSGETGVFAGPRVWKDDPRIEAFGCVDELNAVLGWTCTLLSPGEPLTWLTQIQHQLFSVGAELATPEPAKQGTDLIGTDEITALERAIDQMELTLAPLKQFILPGGS